MSATTLEKPAPEESKTQPADEPFVFQDNELVTLLYRYGEVGNRYKQLLGTTRFIGGVARDVPGITARQLLQGTRTITLDDGREIVKRAYFRAHNLYALPNTSSEVDFARYAKIKVDPLKVAALLAAADIPEVVRLLGTKATADLIERLERERMAQIRKEPGHLAK